MAVAVTVAEPAAADAALPPHPSITPIADEVHGTGRTAGTEEIDGSSVGSLRAEGIGSPCTGAVPRASAGSLRWQPADEPVATLHLAPSDADAASVPGGAPVRGPAWPVASFLTGSTGSGGHRAMNDDELQSLSPASPQTGAPFPDVVLSGSGPVAALLQHACAVENRPD